jgi:hypothetical protein
MRASVTGLLLVTLLLSSCGGDNISLVTDDQAPDTARLEGNVRDVNPQVAGAPIVVFVFTGLRDPGTFQDFDKQRSVAIPADADPAKFTVTQIEAGELTVVFLQDDVGNPDGTIDLCPMDATDCKDDPVATLEDTTDVLDDVRRGETVQITDIDIDFSTKTAEARTSQTVQDTSTQR